MNNKIKIVNTDIENSVDVALKKSFIEISTEELGKLTDLSLSPAQIVNGKWYIPKWGCDSLQHFIDIIKGIK